MRFSDYNTVVTKTLRKMSRLHKRPVYLNLFQIRLPIPAIASILHRMTGVLLFLLYPCTIIFWRMLIQDDSSFQQAIKWLHGGICRTIIWLLLSAIMYHSLAGVRHILNDFGVLSGLVIARTTAWLVIVMSVVFSLVLGYWLC